MRLHLLNYAARLAGVPSGGMTTVNDLLKQVRGPDGEKVIRRELVKTLRALALAGYGRFTIGRHGQPSRFIWAVAPATLGAAMTVSPPTVSPPKQRGDGMFAHPFRLRPGLIISLHLPDDLTPGEADRLSSFVQALPLRIDAAPG